MDEQTVRDLGMGGLVHNIGKARLKLDVLNKSGGRDAARQPHDGRDRQCHRRRSFLPAYTNVFEVCYHRTATLNGTFPEKGDEICAQRQGAGTLSERGSPPTNDEMG